MLNDVGYGGKGNDLFNVPGEYEHPNWADGYTFNSNMDLYYDSYKLYGNEGNDSFLFDNPVIINVVDGELDIQGGSGDDYILFEYWDIYKGVPISLKDKIFIDGGSGHDIYETTGGSGIFAYWNEEPFDSSIYWDSFDFSFDSFDAISHLKTSDNLFNHTKNFEQFNLGFSGEPYYLKLKDKTIKNTLDFEFNIYGVVV